MMTVTLFNRWGDLAVGGASKNSDGLSSILSMLPPESDSMVRLTSSPGEL